ncbi:hypothetical protein N7520_002158 [Penicillium odoratum]|uniref:uncharacterized protein n=1 Tax=Penicillium odoratum TaxID=1167516 RepID=UPI002547762C|nr:uncharacterized protein N7520_002158 [Penicillium odoratum]KAJ5771629.1 hypothetical protein N7520_002158 [Penicillium odoratum]
MDESFRPAPINYGRRPPPHPFFGQDGDHSDESVCGPQRNFTHQPHPQYGRSKQKLPKIEYNQPRFSPYQLPLVNVALCVDDMEGINDRHEIPAKYLQKYPRIFDLLGPVIHGRYIHVQLSGISRRIVHTIAHFVCTGEYETIETDAQAESFDERQDVREEFEKSVEVYHAAKKYEIHDLQVLAEKHMEHFGASMTSKDIISSTRNAFLDLPRGEIWLPNFVKKVIERELVAGKSDANIRAIFGKRNLEGSAAFNATILWMIIDILSARVHDLENEVHIKDNIAPEVKDDREPESVAASEPVTATNKSVRRPEESTSSEDGFVVNGSTVATPEESTANESFASRAIPAAVAADHPDDPVPARTDDRLFRYSTFAWPPFQPPMNYNAFADEPEPAGHVAAYLGEEDVPGAEEPTVEAEEPYLPEPPAEGPPTEDPPAQEAPAEEAPAEEAPAEEAPAEEAPAEEAPAEEAPAEEAPAEEAPAEEAPMEKAPTEKAPAEEALEEETPVEEPAIETTLSGILLAKSKLYKDWKEISLHTRRKRSKVLKKRGLPIPSENGIVSIAL